MAFKSKQRARHGHLFGDDPLSASVSDDPLSATSSRSTSPTTSHKSTSIFGDIDVSKLSRSSSGSSTALMNTNNSTKPGLRSTLASNDDENNDESLFGTKPSRSQATLLPSASSPSRREKSPTGNSNPGATMPEKSASTSSRKSIPTSVSRASLKTTPRSAPTPPPPPPSRQHATSTITIDVDDEATQAFAADTLALSDSASIQPPPAAAVVAAEEASSGELNPWEVPSVILAPSSKAPLPRTTQSHQDNAGQSAAFADLVASWNNPQSTPVDVQLKREDSEEFFSRIAPEQRDIGFAGIADKEDTVNKRQIKLQTWGLDDNPWS